MDKHTKKYWESLIDDNKDVQFLPLFDEAHNNSCGCLNYTNLKQKKNASVYQDGIHTTNAGRSILEKLV